MKNTMNITDPRAFLGTGWKFPPEIDKTTGRIRTSSYEENIAEAIQVLLFTRKGERMMRPEFGSTLYDYMFESMDYGTIRRLEQELTETLLQWEPRILRPKAVVDTGELQKGILYIHVSYIVRSTNNPYNLVFPYYITEGI